MSAQHTPIPSAVNPYGRIAQLEQQHEELLAALEPLTYKFISGNSVSVDRATITAEEWRPVSEALAKAVQS